MNHPIIIVEGPDSCGKTTWCEQYQAAFGARYMHLALHKNLFAYQTVSLVRAMHLAKTSPVLIDRHWPSEQIYGSVYRGSCLQKEAEMLDRFCQRAGVFYVIAVSDRVDKMSEWHAKSSAERDEMFEPSQKYLEVLRGYADWWFGTKTCLVDTGHCRSSSPMCLNVFSSIRYDREMFKGRDGLLDHVKITQIMATTWRNYCLTSSRLNKLTKTQLIKECGYEAHAENSNSSMA